MTTTERDALKRIGRLTFRRFWQGTVLYLGIKPEVAMKVWRARITS